MYVCSYICIAQAGLLDENGHLPGSKAAFLSAGVATVCASLFGSSPVIIHTESCAGIASGGRTGLHSVVVALLFLLSLPFMPLLSAVPEFVTAPALVIVGMYMMSAAKFIDWERIDEALPAFLCATILPLTYSIANGVIAGLMAFCILKTGAYLSGALDKPMIVTAEDDLHQHQHPHQALMTPSGLHATDDPAPGSPIPYFLDHTQMNGHAPHVFGERRLTHQRSARSLQAQNEYGSITRDENHF